MAVPKKKKSSSRSRMRRGSNGSLDANFPNITTDKTSGEFKLPHHICKADGSYNGRKVIVEKKKKTAQEE